MVQDVASAHFAEIEGFQATLDRRYDEMVGGKVKGLPG